MKSVLGAHNLKRHDGIRALDGELDMFPLLWSVEELAELNPIELLRLGECLRRFIDAAVNSANGAATTLQLIIQLFGKDESSANVEICSNCSEAESNWYMSSLEEAFFDA